MFESIKYENKMHKLLKAVSRQRVALILQPGNVPVVEKAIGSDEDTKALLLTAQIRGWVDILHEGILTGKLNTDGSFQEGKPFQTIENHYRLTDSGWAAIQRRHQLAIISLVIGCIGVLFAIVV